MKGTTCDKISVHARQKQFLRNKHIILPIIYDSDFQVMH